MCFPYYTYLMCFLVESLEKKKKYFCNQFSISRSEEQTYQRLGYKDPPKSANYSDRIYSVWVCSFTVMCQSDGAIGASVL